MVTKQLMRDPVTGKLMRDNATSKLMVEDPYGDDCEYCNPGATPKYITLTVSGLSDCDACFHDEHYGGDGHWKVSGIAVVLNNCNVILEQDPLAPCVWEKIYTDGDFGTLTYYSDHECTGIPYEYAVDWLSFRVEKCAPSGLIISIGVRATAIVEWFMQAFAYEIHTVAPWVCKPASTANCITCSNLANTVDCDEASPWVTDVCCEGGLVSIVEGRGDHYTPPSVQYQNRLPTGDTVFQWSRSVGADNYALVDDPYSIPDDDTTYTYTDTQTNKDLFGFTALAVPTGSIITNVQVVGRFKRIDAGGDFIIRELLKVNGVTYEGSLQQLVVGAYFDKTYTWVVNPNTGLPWTLEDVNGIGSNPLQTFGYECIGFNKTVRCTQVYVKVNYVYYW